MMLCYFVFYAPNFKEVEEAHWFGPVHPCVHGWVTLCIQSRMLEIGSGNLIYGISMKNKRTHDFFLFRQTFRCRVMPLFRHVFYIAIISLWNLVNKIS